MVFIAKTESKKEQSLKRGRGRPKKLNVESNRTVDYRRACEKMIEKEFDEKKFDKDYLPASPSDENYNSVSPQNEIKFLKNQLASQELETQSYRNALVHTELENHRLRIQRLVLWLTTTLFAGITAGFILF